MRKDLKKLYTNFASVLEEGRPERAGRIFKKIVESELENEETDDEEVEEETLNAINEFEEINGVGSELAIELEDRYGDIENMKTKSVEELAEIPGIGEVKAKDLLDKVNE